MEEASKQGPKKGNLPKKKVARKKPVEVPIEEQPPQTKDDQKHTRSDHLVVIDGRERYLTKASIIVAIQQGKKVEIPKGSKLRIPLDAIAEANNCTGCGR